MCICILCRSAEEKIVRYRAKYHKKFLNALLLEKHEICIITNSGNAAMTSENIQKAKCIVRVKLILSCNINSEILANKLSILISGGVLENKIW